MLIQNELYLRNTDVKKDEEDMMLNTRLKVHSFVKNVVSLKDMNFFESYLETFAILY